MEGGNGNDVVDLMDDTTSDEEEPSGMHYNYGTCMHATLCLLYWLNH